MGYCSLICISVLAFNVISCDSSHKDAAHNTNSKSADTAQSARTQADTVPNMPSPPEPAPAPGTLRLQGRVIEIRAAYNDSSTIYKVKVLKTLGIGAGTPALVRNDTVKIISSKQSPKITNAMDVICLIKNRRKMAQHEDRARGWQLLEWELKNDQK